MKRVRQDNINTPSYWDAIYSKERAQNRSRVDERRLQEVLRWSQVRQEEVQRLPTILDVGCGLGDLSRYLGDHLPGAPVSGVDISSDCIAYCRQRASKGAVLREARADSLPFEDESFDIVWCGETLEHLDDPEKALLEIRRVTEEHGFILISTPYRRRNTSEEHLWEFAPSDVAAWGALCGELVFLDCLLLPSWLTMFAAFRRAVEKEPS